MKQLEMLVVNENGQLEVDWSSLELLTNAEFVKEVKRHMRSNFAGSTAELVEINETDNYVNVYIADANYYIAVSFMKRINSISVNMVNIGEIRTFVNHLTKKGWW
jgi:hypothetical protein